MNVFSNLTQAAFVFWTCVLAVFSLYPACANSSDVGKDELYDKFVSPSKIMRPYVYWWWEGTCFTKEEIARELALMDKAGIGGVQIIPIGIKTPCPHPDAKPVQWLSKEWMELLRYAAQTAKQLDMEVSISAAFAWPSGGDFLKTEHRLQAVSNAIIPVSGPDVFSKTLTEVIGYDFNPESRRLMYARLVPEILKDMTKIVDVQENVSNGSLKFAVPKGKYLLYVGIMRPEAKRTALDYLNPQAVDAYFAYWEKQLHSHFAADVGSLLDAMYTDSLEIWPCNWTWNFKEEFQKRRGYDISPYMHFAVGMQPNVTKPSPNIIPDSFVPSEEMADTLRRVRYDYARTLVDLLRDNYTTKFNEWCHSIGIKSRGQGYGWPWHWGIAENYMIYDIPEGNNWLYSTLPGHHWEALSWNKYASSAARLSGRPVVSCESMTTVAGIFQVSLDLLKRSDDLNFISGMNHATLHGYCYNPPHLEWPGQFKYGTWLSERNPWWPYFSKWAQYNSRLSQLFQISETTCDVALIGPTADLWSDYGLSRKYFNESPWYLHKLWVALSNLGIDADYLHENVIQRASFEDGALRFGPMKYKLLIVCDVQTLEPATAKAIERFARAGGKIAFVGKTPSRSGTLMNAKTNDLAVAAAIDKAIKYDGQKIKVMTAPKEEKDLIAWSDLLLKSFSYDRSVRFSNPSDNLFALCYQHGQQDIYFLTNQDANNPVQTKAKFSFEGKIPWRWDPETGQRSVYPHQPSGELSIQLQPSQSLLLVFEPGTEKESKPLYSLQPNSLGNSTQIDTAWQLKLIPVNGESRKMKIDTLFDFSEREETKTFAGVIEYSTVIDLPQTAGTYLDLGPINGVSQLLVNGTDLGTRWYGRHLYDVRSAWKEGSNDVMIRVTTLAFNAVKVKQKEPRISTGLKGPVMLYSNPN